MRGEAILAEPPGSARGVPRASPGGTGLSRGAVSRAVGGRRGRAFVLSVQQVCTAWWQAVQQIWSGGGACARRPPRASRTVELCRVAERVRGGLRARRAAALASRGGLRRAGLGALW
eukprot:CAMPEP_0185342788 /NCGR_PEP_ID=MMETSP1363-20130426/99298_1 /TAXON_ID=38817 /ORGANISM="Gephyrocapsa oceanica, Strain RCC1303" /LENGTH=116 /DNA_ID=CAMNT_0027942015 /DNA_START=375 /DNA_END=725 /DNA_ORIENTATION=+